MAKKKKDNLFEPIIFSEPVDRPLVDEWTPAPEDEIFTTIKGAILMDVSSFYGLTNNPNLDTFYLKSKRSYNNQKVRDHTVLYLNYFEKFYDFDRELPAIYSTIKYLIDYEPSYNKDAFFYDLKRYIIHGPISIKVRNFMVEDNYTLSLTYRNKKNPALQYLDRHAKLLMTISILMNMMIPLLCHFMTMRQITKNSSQFLLEIYDEVLHIDPDIDIYSKLYETAETNVEKAAKDNPGIFAKQDIRGINVTTHAIGWLQTLTPLHMVTYVDHSSNCWELLKLICHNGSGPKGNGLVNVMEPKGRKKYEMVYGEILSTINNAQSAAKV